MRTRELFLIQANEIVESITNVVGELFNSEPEQIENKLVKKGEVF